MTEKQGQKRPRGAGGGFADSELDIPAANPGGRGEAATGGLSGRLRAEWRRKASMTIALPAAFWGPYLALQRWPLFPVRAAPHTVVDDWIPFDPRWAGVYLTIQAPLLLPWLARTRGELARFTKGFAAVCGASFLAFLLAPTAVRRPASDGLLGWIAEWDGPGNACPSLHAGLTVLAFLFGRRILSRSLSVAAYVAAAAGWGGLILFAALATKQHTFADVAAGALLAWAAHRWAWRDAQHDNESPQPG